MPWCLVTRGDVRTKKKKYSWVVLDIRILPEGPSILTYGEAEVHAIVEGEYFGIDLDASSDPRSKVHHTQAWVMGRNPNRGEFEHDWSNSIYGCMRPYRVHASDTKSVHGFGDLSPLHFMGLNGPSALVEWFEVPPPIFTTEQGEPFILDEGSQEPPAISNAQPGKQLRSNSIRVALLVGLVGVALIQVGIRSLAGTAPTSGLAFIGAGACLLAIAFILLHSGRPAKANQD